MDRIEYSKQLYDTLEMYRNMLETNRSATEDVARKGEACAYVMHRTEDAHVPAVKLYTSIPEHSVKNYNNGLISYLCPRNECWLRLTTSGPGDDAITDKIPGAGKWLDETRDEVLATYAHNNFYSSMNNLGMDGQTTGHGCMFTIDDMRRREIYHEIMNPFEYVMQKGPSGKIEIFVRRIKMSAMDIFFKYGREVMPPQMQKSFDEGNGNTKYEVIEFIYRTDAIRNTSTGRPFDYAMQDSRGNKPRYMHVVYPKEQEGTRGNNVYLFALDTYNEMPVAEWTPYGGLGNVEMHLPDVININDMYKNRMKLHQRNVDPPVTVPYSLEGSFSSAPGSVNVVRTMDEKPEPWLTGTDTNSFLLDIQDGRQTLDMLIGTDLIRTIMDNRRDRTTATEVNVSKNEALIVLLTSIVLLVVQVIEPTVKRTIRILGSKGIISKPPAELAKIIKKGGLNVELEGTFINRVRAWTKADAIAQTFGTLAQLQNLDPSVLRNFNINQGIREMAVGMGYPRGLLRDMQEVTKLQKQDAQVQIAQMQQQAQLTQSEIARNEGATGAR